MLKRRINEYGQGIRGTSLSNGLVSWYGLNGTTEDSTSNTNPSVIGDITYTQDLGRKVGYFNGYSCIDTNTSNFGLSTGSNITLSCFVKFTDISLADQGLIHQYNGDWDMSGIQKSGRGFMFNIRGRLNQEFNYSYNTGVWYNVTSICSGSTVKTYVNNELKKITSMGYTGMAFGSEKFYIGGFWSIGESRRLRGYLSSAGVWDRALTTNEIELLYNNGIGISY